MNPPLNALSWMILNEIDQSSERLEDLFHNDKQADAKAELLDVIAATEWLEWMGVDVTRHRAARLLPEIEAEILAWTPAPIYTAEDAAAKGYRVQSYFGPKTEGGPDQIHYGVIAPDGSEADDGLYSSASDAWAVAARVLALNGGT